MLNKLLKKCMPWMDKGRWYHIQIKTEFVSETLSVTDVTFDDPMFSHYEYDPTDLSPSVKVYFSDPDINAAIVDYKVIAHAIIPGETSFILNPSNIDVGVEQDDSGYYIRTYPIPGVIDMWLFIKTN